MGNRKPKLTNNEPAKLGNKKELDRSLAKFYQTCKEYNAKHS